MQPPRDSTNPAIPKPPVPAEIDPLREYTAWTEENIPDETEKQFERKNFERWLKSCQTKDRNHLQTLINSIKRRLASAEQVKDAAYIKSRAFYLESAEHALSLLSPSDH